MKDSLITSKREINRNFETDVTALFCGMTTLATSYFFLASTLNLTSLNTNPSLAFMQMLTGTLAGLSAIITYKGFKIFSEKAGLLNYYSQMLHDLKKSQQTKTHNKQNKELLNEMSK